MSEFKVGDRVGIRAGIEFEKYCNQTGVIELDHAGGEETWKAIRWPDGQLRGYRNKDIILKEPAMEIPAAFLQDLHKCTCMPDVRANLEKHFPALFPKELPLEPGYYRDREGSLYMLLEIGSRWKLCSPTHTYQCSDNTYLFDNYGPNLSELRAILSTMERVENP